MALLGTSLTSFHGMQPHEIEALWPVWWPMLARSEEYNYGIPMEEEAVKCAIKECKIQAWYGINDGVMEIAATTEIWESSRGKTLEIAAVGGSNLKNWHNAIDMICKWGAELGCKRVVTTGRKPMARVLSKLGFTEVATMNERLL